MKGPACMHVCLGRAWFKKGKQRSFLQEAAKSSRMSPPACLPACSLAKPFRSPLALAVPVCLQQTCLRVSCVPVPVPVPTSRRDMLWKMWQKAPENPLNQAAAAAAAQR